MNKQNKLQKIKDFLLEQKNKIDLDIANTFIQKDKIEKKSMTRTKKCWVSRYKIWNNK